MNNELFSDELFSKILMSPAQKGVSDLYIVSGYASSAMVSYHAEILEQQKLNINIHLIIGMTSRDGLSEANHRGFQSLMENELSNRFECSYLINPPPVHSKVYSWVQEDNIPVKGFMGSVNYSQNAFLGNRQKEVATECNPESAFKYYQSLINDTIYCNHIEAEELIMLHKDNKFSNSTQSVIEAEGKEQDDVTGLEKVTVSLISKNGDVATRAGLNWGQRSKRNPNQAYIQLPPHVYKSDFFPLRPIHFTILTDDGKILVCTRAQKDWRGNAIETPQNNSQLGEYFRYRLELPNGGFVTKDDLIKYGRTDIDFYKIDEENYYMDFSSKK